jgi:hypothetical protein
MCLLRPSSRVGLGFGDTHCMPLISVLPREECLVGRYSRHGVLSTDNAPSARRCPIRLTFPLVPLSHLVCGAVYGRAIVQNNETLRSRGRCSCKQLIVDILAENSRLCNQISKCWYLPTLKSSLCVGWCTKHRLCGIGAQKSASNQKL